MAGPDPDEPGDDGCCRSGKRLFALLPVAPALAMVLALFVYPLGFSLVSAFTTKDGHPTFGNFAKTFDLYGFDIVFTALILATSTVLTGILAAAIGGYLVLGAHPTAVIALRWLYRWPLFIPFIVAAQCMRTFLAKNGMLNNTLDALGLVDVESLSGLLDWRGIIVTFVWKETPFVALLVSGAMASLDRAGIEAARNLGAGGLRILVEILLPQVTAVLTVALILAFVTMLSVLSVPIMLSGGSPTMITADMAFRVNSYSDYGVANALGFVSYLIAGSAAWLYLRRAATDAAR
jgi:putative spermidine/putrescine transport system permease protein